MQKVRKGDPLKIAANDWNQIVDAVARSKAQLNDAGGREFNAGYGDGIIRVQNLGDAAIGIYTVVQLTSHAPSMNYDTQEQIKATPDYYTGALPTDASAPYAVTQEAIEPGMVGRAMVYGITPVKFEGSTGGTFADPSTASQGQMTPSASGSARILAQPTDGNPWGVVLLGCGGGGSGEAQPLQAWQILNTENGLYVVRPEWELNAPYSEYPAGATRPVPEYATSFDNTVDPDFAVIIQGKQCYYVTDACCAVGGGSDVLTKYTRVYAVMNQYGSSWGTGLALDSDPLTETPCCVLIAKINRANDGTVLSVEQVRKGPIKSTWLETERFYVITSSSGDTRYTQAPLGLDEGTLLPSYTYWKMQTVMDGELVAVGEDMNYREDAGFPNPQIALTYDVYIYRYNLHYDSSINGLIADTVTTPVINVDVSPFARIVASPFVQKIQVTYPETPLEQGSVDSVGGTINVLAVEDPTVAATKLFNTETIDVTETSTHQGV